MKQLTFLFSMVCLMALMSCTSGTKGQAVSDAHPSVTDSGDIILPEEAISASKDVIRKEFAKDANFVDEECIAYDTNVSGRYRVEGRFSSVEKDHSSFVFLIYIQKFSSGWEYGNFKINDAYDGKSLVFKNGRMKEMEQNEGVGDVLSAGGIDFTIAEKKPTVIRIYTDQKLSRAQLKAVIIDLRDKYDGIQFATTAKHERGDEYASWTANIFFDYDTNEIINKSEFLNEK